MKKTIKILVEKMDKLQEKKDGSLRGGFASIKGGVNGFDFNTNSGCTNSKDCSHDTNSGLPCTNTGTCFA